MICDTTPFQHGGFFNPLELKILEKAPFDKDDFVYTARWHAVAHDWLRNYVKSKREDHSKRAYWNIYLEEYIYMLDVFLSFDEDPEASITLSKDEMIEQLSGTNHSVDTLLNIALAMELIHLKELEDGNLKITKRF